MTYPMTRKLRFTIDVPRYRWELGSVSGEPCLIPMGPSVGRYTGGRGVLKFLETSYKRGPEELLAFANENSGLLIDGHEPRPEPISLWTTESLVFDRLWLLRRMRLVMIESDKWSGRLAGAPRRRSQLVKDPEEWMKSSAAWLREELPKLRPGYTPPASLASHPSAEVIAIHWLNATVAEQWLVEFPITPWIELPLLDRATRLPAVEPVVRCRTLLGFAYAALFAAYDERYQTLELLRNRKMPGVDLVPGRCRQCGDPLESSPMTGRKQRSDTKWCDRCRRTLNTEAQRNRRSASGKSS